jgi:hypothetical protein
MPRFFCQLTVKIRGGDGSQPAVPPAPFSLTAFNNTSAKGLSVPYEVIAEYAASRDVTATDGLDAMTKVGTFANNQAPGLVPVNGRVAEVHVAVAEWPT